MNDYSDKPFDIEISVVCPVNNEEQTIRELCTRIDETLRNDGCSYEIIIVDDASDDSTPTILDELLGQIACLKVLRLTRINGQGIAIYAGVQNSVGKYVVIMDGDLQNLPEEIPLLVNKAREGFDIVSGLRQHRTESLLLKRVPSAIANWLLRTTTGCPAKDMGGFKCLNGDIARQIHMRSGHHRLLPAIVWGLGGSLAEIPVSFPPRKTGKSHYGISRSFDVACDIMQLWFKNSFKSRPLYLFGRIAFALFFLGAVIIAYLLFERFVMGINMGTRPPFLFSILFLLASMGFMATGFILEQLSETFCVVTQQKPYRVQQCKTGKSAQPPRDEAHSAGCAESEQCPRH